MHAHFELLAAFFVYVWAFDNGEGTAVGWQRNWAGDSRAGTQGGVNDLLCGLVDYFVVVGLQADADTLLLVFLWFYHLVDSFLYDAVTSARTAFG